MKKFSGILRRTIAGCSGLCALLLMGTAMLFIDFAEKLTEYSGEQTEESEKV